MPFRSPKMYSFIFGFPRFVWWPKCTPASSRSFIAIPDKFAPFPLAFAELEPLARAGHAVLLAFLDARVRREQAVLLQRLPQFGAVLDQGSRDAEPHGAGLAVDAATGNRRQHVELLDVLRQRQRPPHVHPQRLGGEVLVELAVIDGDRAVAGAEEHAGGGCLAATRSVVFDAG